MKKLLVLLVVAISAVAQTNSASPTPSAASKAAAPATSAANNDQPTREQVAKFLDLMHLKEQTQLLLDGFIKNAKAGAHQAMEMKAANLSPKDQARLNRFTDETFDDLFKDVSIDELVAVSIPIYQKHLTKADLDGLIAFYSSPTGQKLLKEMPTMTQEAMEAGAQLMQPKLAGIMERLDQRSNAMLQEIQAEHEQKTAKPAGAAEKKN